MPEKVGKTPEKVGVKRTLIDSDEKGERPEKQRSCLLDDPADFLSDQLHRIVHTVLNRRETARTPNSKAAAEAATEPFRRFLMIGVREALSNLSVGCSVNRKRIEAAEVLIKVFEFVSIAKKGQQVFALSLKEGKVKNLAILRSMLLDPGIRGSLVPFGCFSPFAAFSSCCQEFDPRGQLTDALEDCLYHRKLSKTELESFVTFMFGDEVLKTGIDWGTVDFSSFAEDLAALIPAHLNGRIDDVERLVAFLRRNRWVMEVVLNVDALAVAFRTRQIPACIYRLASNLEFDGWHGDQEVEEGDEEGEWWEEPQYLAKYPSIATGGFNKLCFQLLNFIEQRIPLKEEDQYGLYVVEKKGCVKDAVLLGGIDLMGDLVAN
jgi:hypothetical protein